MQSAKKRISILGATGSVGESTADIIAAHPERFDVQAVTANRDAEGLAARARALRAKLAVIADKDAYGALKEALAGTGIEAQAGEEALCAAAARPCDLVIAAIAGFAGLLPLMAAIRQGTNVAVANKEPLVAAGPLVMAAARDSGSVILPLDSEHNAVFQVFDEGQRAGIRRIILTASGGPFRTWSAARMAGATPDEALAHPNWSMGRKISVDSATMMNKALEVIEAHYLFGMDPEAIDVVVHPQSIIHSMVEYADGSVLAQMGAPDMRTPIAYCLGWPDRMDGPGRRLDFSQVVNIEISPVDKDRFGAMDLAYAALRRGASACVALNAANEAAVQAFLERRCGFADITASVSAILDKVEDRVLKSVEDVVTFDQTVRNLTEDHIRTINIGKESSAA